MTKLQTTRRAMVLGAIATVGTPALLLGQTAPAIESASQKTVRQNISSFSSQDWRDHFSELGKSAIVCDMASRALHYWSGDGADYRIYPTSVPRTEELTRRGHTEIVRKSSDGCVGLYNDKIAELFELAPVGTQVRLV